MEEDITIEFYYKKATYISPITGLSTAIDIKQVLKNKHSLCEFVTIISTNGVEYPERQLTDFTI